MKYHYFRVNCDKQCPEMIKHKNEIRISRMTDDNLGVYQLTSLTTSQSSKAKIVPSRITKKHLFDCTKRDKLSPDQLKICENNAECYKELEGHKIDSRYTKMVKSELCDERTSQCKLICPADLPRTGYCCLGLRSLLPDPPSNFTDDEDYSGSDSSGDYEDRILDNDTLPSIVEAQPFLGCNLLLKVGLPVFISVIILFCILYLCKKGRKRHPSRRLSKALQSEKVDLLDSTQSITSVKPLSNRVEHFPAEIFS